MKNKIMDAIRVAQQVKMLKRELTRRDVTIGTDNFKMEIKDVLVTTANSWMGEGFSIMDTDFNSNIIVGSITNITRSTNQDGELEIEVESLHSNYIITRKKLTTAKILKLAYLNLKYMYVYLKNTIAYKLATN